ncbi:MAG: hypothetical protein JWN02_1233 [Acidobacteria bacterium]|nr:hypothetical protein [Acidobacteriota bacterium]
MLKRLAVAATLLQLLTLSAAAAPETPKECGLCAGAVAQPGLVPLSPIPLLFQLNLSDLPAGTAVIDALSPEMRKQTTVVVTVSLDRDKEPLGEIEQQTKSIVEWARAHGPFDAVGIAIENADPANAGYAIKRLAVAVQGQNIASRIVLARTTPEMLAKLYDTGAQAYFDALLVDADHVAETAKWLEARDPAKRVLAIVPGRSPNAFFDVAQALADGATRAYLTSGTQSDLAAIANFNRALAGDYAYDSTSHVTVLDAKGAEVSMPVLTLVRGEDLRTLLVPRGDAAGASIVSLPGDRFARPRRIDAAGERDITDVGRKNGRFLIGQQAVKQPFVLSVDHADKLDANVTKEAIDVATKRGITVEEIIRNHQAYKSYQESIQPRYVAKDTTKLRFTMNGGEAIEAAIAGDYFSAPGENGHTKADWVWQDFFINGVRWKYGRIPELPLIQPEKVTQLPLDIHLTNEYRYQLVRETDLLGYHVYEVRFEPPPKASAALPLYRGTVFIDARTFARIRISMIQLNLSGEVHSNEERVDFAPFARDGHAPLSSADVGRTDARSIIWLPLDVSAQQVVSAAGRANPVLRSTTFSNFRLDPPEFEHMLQQVSGSDARMVRETDKGLQYLEKRGNERVVKEGFDTSRTFMLGGLHHDGGLDYPVVPLGGLDYFNFNLHKSGIQTNVFFAGIILAANATHPNVANTRTNVGVDFFGIAVPVTSSIYRNGIEQKNEAVKSVPLGLTLRAGHPFLEFGKIDVSLGLSHQNYQRSQDTAAGFEVPADTFTINPGIDAQYSRWGWTLSGWYDWSKRTNWKPWGNLAEYDQRQQTYTTFGGSVGKSFYLPKFQRISIAVDYLDGQRLDRFSKYELGFFGSRRVHGIRSGSVRAEKAILSHLSYGFVFSDQFRLEAFYDHALIDDATAGYSREPFQGIGLAGQTIGPWGTLLRLDLGKTIGRNAQDGFVANVVFLKLF